MKINNLNIHYIRKGKGPKLVFIHGIFCCSNNYSSLINILSENYEVFALDLPMHGLSDTPNHYLSVDDFSSVFENFIKKLKITNPIICAHSGGSLVAIDYASKNPVKKLLLLEPVGLPFKASLTSILFRLLFIKTLHGFFHNPFVSLKMNFMKLFKQNTFNNNYWKLISDNFKLDYSNKLKKIKAETIIFWAKDDEVFPYKHAQDYLNIIKNSKLITVTGGHDWPMLKPGNIKFYKL